MNIFEKNKKPLQFRSIDIDNYLEILKSNSNKNNIKPIIKNTKTIDLNNIINKIEKKKELIDKIKNNKKIKLTKNITQRNIDFIKIIQKRGNVHNISKEKFKKKIDLKNSGKNENSQKKYTYNIKTEKKNRNSSSDKKEK